MLHIKVSHRGHKSTERKTILIGRFYCCAMTWNNVENEIKINSFMLFYIYGTYGKTLFFPYGHH